MADTYLTLLEQKAPEIEAIIAPYFTPKLWLQNARNLWNIIQRDDKLRACSPSSLVACVEEAARRGLEIGGPNKHCAPVAFKSTAVLITQWQGRAFIWTKSGAIKKLMADVVYDGDTFEIHGGDEDRIVHVKDYTTDHSPSWLNDINNIVGAYAIAWLWSGEKQHSFVTRSQLKRVMEWTAKKNGGSLGFGWNDWKPEMCMKTAVHRLEGKIQPPPHMETTELEAWQRAASASSVEAEFENVDGMDTPPDLPTPKAVTGEIVSEPKVKPAAAKKNETVASEKPIETDRPITLAEATELSDLAESLSLTFKTQKAVLVKLNVGDFEELKLSQLEQAGKLLQEAAG